MTKSAVLINDTLSDGHFGCHRVVRTIEKLANDNGITICERNPVHADWQDNSAILKAIEATDIILVNGEGTIHHDRQAGRNLVEVANYCAQAGKPSVLLNASWFSNSSELADSARNFTLISVRESESASQLRAAGLDCRVTADLALHEAINPRSRTGATGVTDSVCSKTALELDLLRRESDGEVINIFHGRRGVSGFRFYVRAFGGQKAITDPAKTIPIFRAAQAFYRSQFRKEEDFLNRIAQLELLITGRFHAAIFSLTSLTPLLALESSTPKISATLKDAGVANWRVTLASDIDRDLLGSASRWHKDEEDNIRDFLSDNRLRQTQLFKDIAALAA